MPAPYSLAVRAPRPSAAAALRSSAVSTSRRRLGHGPTSGVAPEAACAAADSGPKRGRSATPDGAVSSVVPVPVASGTKPRPPPAPTGPAAATREAATRAAAANPAANSAASVPSSSPSTSRSWETPGSAPRSRLFARLSDLTGTTAIHTPTILPVLPLPTPRWPAGTPARHDSHSGGADWPAGQVGQQGGPSGSQTRGLATGRVERGEAVDDPADQAGPGRH